MSRNSRLHPSYYAAITSFPAVVAILPVGGKYQGPRIPYAGTRAEDSDRSLFER